MKRMPFEPPTEHYDERIKAIDEQICYLIKKRKDLSNNNPSFPTKQLITAWSKKYNFYEDFLNSVFADFLNENIYKPVVEPKRLLKNIPILKSLRSSEHQENGYIRSSGVGKASSGPGYIPNFKGETIHLLRLN
ncbi:hypothetical protein [Lederbergia citrea]|uniref:hypothetical protein n=1 Tax=Lederbergia citrea TaxID=2833581 RepID=UPI001BC8F8E9|nr:hypothetical protein [Lederbergia citrea]MBS4176979.1 hypothetical protein [Lederbergia citrea]MBS4203553.1 hypothetical protein [Lederbergia citrea]